LFFARIAFSLSGNKVGGKVVSDSGPDFQRRLSLEAPGVLEFRDPNGATRSPGPKTQSPWRRLPEPYCQRVMVSDGDCAFRCAGPIAPVRRFSQEHEAA
jgi:hypothetical protein